MTNNLNEYPNQNSPGNESGNAKVPSGGVDTSTNETHPQNEGKSAKDYVDATFEILRMTVIWLGWYLQWVWRNVIINDKFWVAAATITIAVATIYYTIYAKKQWKTLGEQLTAMQGQLNETHESFELQKQVTKATFGAEVDLDRNIMGVFRWEQGKQFWVDVHVINYGKKEARRVTIAAKFDFRPSAPIPSERIFNLGDSKLATQPIPLRPYESSKDFAYLRFVKDISPQEYPTDRSNRLYVWGTVFYLDFTGRSSQEFCQYAEGEAVFRIPPIGGPNGTAGYTSPYEPCPYTPN